MLVTVMVAVVMTATMTTGHNDDSEPLFPTERFRKRMSRATKKPFSADAPLHISQNRFATTNAPEPVPLASSRTAPSLNYARGWHARVCVVVARQRQCLKQPPTPQRRPRRLVPTTGAPPSWCFARRLRRRRLCFARRLRLHHGASCEKRRLGRRAARQSSASDHSRETSRLPSHLATTRLMAKYGHSLRAYRASQGSEL